MNPILNLELTIEEVNKVLTGLESSKKDLDNLSQKIVRISQVQIDEYNKKLEEEQKKIEEDKKSKDKGENK